MIAAPEKDGIVPFDALIDQSMSVEPYRSAPRVFVIADTTALLTATNDRSIAKPFQSKFTRSDLDNLLDRLDDNAGQRVALSPHDRRIRQADRASKNSPASGPPARNAGAKRHLLANGTT